MLSTIQKEEVNAFQSLGTGNRIATFMYYVSFCLYNQALSSYIIVLPKFIWTLFLGVLFESMIFKLFTISHKLFIEKLCAKKCCMLMHAMCKIVYMNPLKIVYMSSLTTVHMNSMKINKHDLYENYNLYT